MKINKQQLHNIILQEARNVINQNRYYATKDNLISTLETCAELLKKAAEGYLRDGREEEKRLYEIYFDVHMDAKDMANSLRNLDR